MPYTFLTWHGVPEGCVYPPHVTVHGDTVPVQ